MPAAVHQPEQMLSEAVLWHLAWDPQADAGDVKVSSREGVVTLKGHVDRYAAKLAAERAARRVAGVKRIVNHLEVNERRVDRDIAKAAREALENRIDVPRTVAVTVRNGQVTLTGSVEHVWQKRAAERTVRYLAGVLGVINRVDVNSGRSHGVRNRILDTLRTHPDLGRRSIQVDVEGPVVTVTGIVGSWIEKEEVERAAWRVSGVGFIDSRLTVRPDLR